MTNETPNHSTGRQFLLMPEWIRHYEKSWAKPDLIAGLTAAAVVIPKALAYATVAGLPVQVGLYTAFVPMLIYACLGTSRPLSVSTTTTLAILVAAGIGEAVPDGNEAGLITATATLTLMVGAILTLASALRLGFVANFISEPVLIGFKAGIAVVIVVDQIPKLLGIHFPKGSFAHNLLAIFQALPHASLLTILVGALTLVVLVGLEHFFPRVPAPLIAVAGAIAGASLFGLAARGVGTVGHIPTGLPAITLPDFSLMAVLWPVALGTALMSFTETIAAGRAFVRDGEPTPGANRELLATGMANLGGSLFGAMPGGGGTTQTAVNRSAGARSQAAQCVTAAAALGVMLLLAPLIGLIPHATLAAVVIVYSIGLFNPAEFRAILAVRRTELVWALVALAGVVLLGTLQGILVAIVVSLIALAYQVSDPPVHELVRKRGTNVFRPISAERSDDESFPGLLMLRPEGRIFFANADNVALKIRQHIAKEKPAIVVLDLSGVFDIEYTALRMLIDAEKKMHDASMVLWLAALNPGVLAMVQRSPLAMQLGRERMFYNLEQVVARYDAGRRHEGV
ncbi:SulP family inorganic anion transporter [Paraburkholderia metrosideri]|uniref:Sulfate transporter n=1 Tax=Paraburkholderia metrosideri TaxID=580937 RepID=A0ABM8NLS8_9BURK|nr:SulP family inorganic anion transporter [Paraburkholderia metrosideri]CAD6532108.1 putative sulfate transporter [Paraburkholderia metrosideri]